MSEEREKILKLGQMITDRIGHKVTVEDPEYWGLASVVTDEMAEVALKMKVRKPMTLKQLAAVTKKRKRNWRTCCMKCVLSGFWSITGRIRRTKNSMFCQCLCQEVQNLRI